jgi:hypothetical protein
MVSSLLSLPGELRIKIYQYALSEADGLKLVVKDCGSSCLRLHGGCSVLKDSQNSSDNGSPDETAIAPLSPAMYTVS